MVRVVLLCLILAGLNACKVSEDPWATTCQMYDALEVSEGREAGACDNIDAPVIVYEPMEGGLMGYYDGSDTIYVRDELKGDARFALSLIHI